MIFRSRSRLQQVTTVVDNRRIPVGNTTTVRHDIPILPHIGSKRVARENW
ncbi:MAG: hypothetical protein VYD01_04370 [Pseudomonadota bacterium]|nr:hypothetical protein [Pseudomonadota bacterium]MEE3237127.1 hypothetical protein [Pseudomonadota bacterium]